MTMQSSVTPAIVVMSFCLCGAAPAPITPEGTPQIMAARDGGSDKPVIITSDTKAYCNRLLNIIDAYGPALPQDVDSLRMQGADMCREGRIRSGIVRLRRALVELKETTHS
ncbi:hypothetical protein B0W47_06830 [Komagataeibacter nataicola]|uniref:UrcA family protein n=1 Tax=Komagataeibacter nataicola TaxID=265960 RepID=A0A9N7C740_9PROT|nr:hypothetical protein [Komagataeibacter nataicola]AQU87236.1 hypothetical protein B0W47_06830 [Komagataeibacter nataicola]PYD67502.1 hypothetical protein CDI09_03000 [Komagataeibacter nataicola]WEQ55883.1 hypothetical protein LV564_01845 [Komagataeibacter nataicola]WNM09257.1 hypothetical protein RI056_04510 [Komagataeibacter nataicola]